MIPNVCNQFNFEISFFQKVDQKFKNAVFFLSKFFRMWKKCIDIERIKQEIWQQIWRNVKKIWKKILFYFIIIFFNLTNMTMFLFFCVLYWNLSLNRKNNNHNSFSFIFHILKTLFNKTNSLEDTYKKKLTLPSGTINIAVTDLGRVSDDVWQEKVKKADGLVLCCSLDDPVSFTDLL